jgi:hypothetical protein
MDTRTMADNHISQWAEEGHKITKFIKSAVSILSYRVPEFGISR